MNHELLKELYEFEWKLKETLTSSVNIPILGITAIGGAAATIALDAKFASHWLGLGMAVILGAIGVGLVLAVFFVVRSLLTTPYKKLPNAAGMNQTFDDLIVWHTSQGAANPAAAAQVDFDAALRERLVDAIDRNGAVNHGRSEDVRFATITVVAILVLIGVAAVGHLITKLGEPQPVQQVHLVKDICI